MSRGESAGSGSQLKTSSPAPARRSSLSARARASSSLAHAPHSLGFGRSTRAPGSQDSREHPYGINRQPRDQQKSLSNNQKKLDRLLFIIKSNISGYLRFFEFFALGDLHMRSKIARIVIIDLVIPVIDSCIAY